MLSRFRSVRFLLGVVLFFAVLFGSAWVALPVAIALCLRWRAWEVIVLGVAWDLLWLPNGIAPESPPLATLIACLLVLGLEVFRRELLIRSPQY